MHGVFEKYSYSRIKGLSDAHFLATSLRDPILLMTLPFDQNRVPRYLTDNVLFRVRQRWEWFSKARKLNTALGTLSYLPAEVRSMIWQNILHCEDTRSLDGTWEYDHNSGPPYRLSSFYIGFGRRGLFLETVENVRLVSSQTKAEYDHVFLHMRTFRFNYSDNLFNFLDRLKGADLQQLSSLELGICTNFSMQPWLDSITYLPMGLQYLHFRLHPTPPNWYHDQQGLESLERLGTVVEQASQRAQKAQIFISGVSDTLLDQICQAAVNSILTRLQQMERNTHLIARL